MVELGNHDHDGRVEVWIGQAADGSEYKDGVCVYVPMVWTEPGFVSATGNYDTYLKERISELKQELKNNPYDTGSSEYNVYEKEHRDAIDAVRKMMKDPSSAAAE